MIIKNKTSRVYGFSGDFAVVFFPLKQKFPLQEAKFKNLNLNSATFNCSGAKSCICKNVR